MIESLSERARMIHFWSQPLIKYIVACSFFSGAKHHSTVHSNDSHRFRFCPNGSLTRFAVRTEFVVEHLCQNIYIYVIVGLRRVFFFNSSFRKVNEFKLLDQIRVNYYRFNNLHKLNNL